MKRPNSTSANKPSALHQPQKGRRSPDRRRRTAIGLAATAVTVLALGLGWWAMGHDRAWPAALAIAGLAPASADLPPALFRGGPWLNSGPLKPADLKGKVVLVNFWTYSCINSTRALPYLRAWAAKYKDKGLVVIGVHTPEFAFETDLANVRRGTAQAGISYPVVLDSDQGIWRAFGNDAWPAFYFIGADGRVRRRVVGEGGYDQSERLLQKLLSEARGSPVADRIVPIAGQGVQAPPDGRDLGSPETYVGYARSNAFASLGGVRRDIRQQYSAPSSLGLNHWALSGDWTVGEEFAVSASGSGRVTFRFHARDLHLIMGPASVGGSQRFRVTLDGEPPGASHGIDVDAEGWGRLDGPRMYQLIRQAAPVRDRVFEIEFPETGARVYDFTFG